MPLNTLHSSRSPVSLILTGVLLLSVELTLRNMTDPTPRRATATDAPFVSQFHASFELNPLQIPPGQATNLPSLQEKDSAQVAAKRSVYGGKDDGKHLGGFTSFDVQGISPVVWKYMVEGLGVQSLLDVGCGRGISTSWFDYHDVDVLCVEGSHDAAQQSLLRRDQIVEHDFSRGPWWPLKTYDAVWSVEFLEHVSQHFHVNYLTTFRKAALIFVTSSRWGGWHHVEVHDDNWWITKMSFYGFHYDEGLTRQVRTLAKQERFANITAPNGEFYNAQHIWLSMKVFVNPVVAALPRHTHLLPEHGCFHNKTGPKLFQRECGTGPNGHLETPLDRSFYPLNLTDSMDERWVAHVQKYITKSTIKR